MPDHATTGHTRFYREMHAHGGFPLKPMNRIDPAEVAAAEARLGLTARFALAVDYVVAGNCNLFNHRHDVLLHAKLWYAEIKRLVFYQEIQSAVVYGITTDQLADEVPPVDMCATPLM